MGQYYHPLSMEKKEAVCSHDYDNGLKLMEHSYIGNDFVAVVENMIAEGGHWFGDRIVWAGDYADPEVDENGSPLTYKSEDGKDDYELTLYHITGDFIIKPAKVKRPNYRYLVNLDTNEFVDMKKVPATDTWTDKKGKEFPVRIHPLPLLTCEGNGRGGGDFGGKDHKKLVGKWARNRVTISTRKPKDCTELIFDLVE
jgi:hypothetical protein